MWVIALFWPLVAFWLVSPLTCLFLCIFSIFCENKEDKRKKISIVIVIHWHFLLNENGNQILRSCWYGLLDFAEIVNYNRVWLVQTQQELNSKYCNRSL